MFFFNSSILSALASVEEKINTTGCFCDTHAAKWIIQIEVMSYACQLYGNKLFSVQFRL